MDLPDLPAIEVRPFLGARRQLRISFVTETYPPDVNGVAMTLQRIVEGLQSLGHDVWLVRPRPLGAPVPEGQDNESLVRGIPIPMYPELKLGLPAKRYLVRLWSRHRPDLVHVATEGPLGWSAIQAAKKLKIPITSDFRTNFHAYSAFYNLGFLKKAILGYMRKFHNTTQCTMVPTDELHQSLALLGFQRLVVVPRGIDTDLFDPAKRSLALRSSWGVGPKTTVLLSVGRIAAEKNLDLTVKAYQQIRDSGGDVRLVFVGDGPLREQIAKACPDAVFTGTQRGEALAAHYASGDVFLFPSVTETFGNVTLEAMASGLAVAAFDCAAARQLIRDAESGCLASLGDKRGFVAIAHRLAADPEFRSSLGRAARRVTLGQGWSKILKKTESVMLGVALQTT
ncbi:glycosyltransferase family 1 protein [beta proteobacterium MWH-UniP1]